MIHNRRGPRIGRARAYRVFEGSTQNAPHARSTSLFVRHRSWHRRPRRLRMEFTYRLERAEGGILPLSRGNQRAKHLNSDHHSNLTAKYPTNKPYRRRHVDFTIRDPACDWDMHRTSLLPPEKQLTTIRIAARVNRDNLCERFGADQYRMWCSRWDRRIRPIRGSRGTWAAIRIFKNAVLTERHDCNSKRTPTYRTATAARSPTHRAHCIRIRFANHQSAIEFLGPLVKDIGQRPLLRRRIAYG
jgi:hypothetical protein